VFKSLITNVTKADDDRHVLHMATATDSILAKIIVPKS